MFLRRLLRKDSQKKVQICLVGLDYAGKTTCVNRLLKRTEDRPTRTIGHDQKTVKYRNLEFRIFDLGGQRTFRETIWDHFISYGEALVFVVDATDPRLDEAAKVLWDVLEKNPEAPVLFLANKYDLEHARPFDKIIDDLDLSRGSRSARPFGLFRISALTGEGFYDAWDWFADTLQAESTFSSCSVHAAILVELSSGKFNVARFKTSSSSALTQFMTELDMISSNLKQYEQGVEISSPYEELQMLCVKRDKYVCALIQRIDDPLVRGRLICERIIKEFNPQFELNSGEEFKEFMKGRFPMDLAS
ncbi:MAG: ADP-ribosylation factor family protein [Candidatus Thorarchaeota archaeon]